MTDERTVTTFAGRAEQLERKVYGSTKGLIRLALLEQDVIDFCPGFVEGGLRVFDIGGGSGRFARICARRGHSVLLCDASEEMVNLAREATVDSGLQENITIRHQDFLADDACRSEGFDLVVMHGSAEWMRDPAQAICKACGCVRPGGYMSLLVFNRDRLLLKQGINGMLVKGSRAGRAGKGLTPPGAMSSAEVENLLEQVPGRILSKSGIRIFYKFFRQGVAEHVLTPDEWLQQERLCYRREPFAGLGEHTHFIWRAGY